MKGLKFTKEVTQGLGMIYFGCKGTWSLRGAPWAGREHQAAVSLVILPAPSKCPLCGSVPSARQGASETTLTDWGPGAGQGSVCPPRSFLTTPAVSSAEISHSSMGKVWAQAWQMCVRPRWGPRSQENHWKLVDENWISYFFFLFSSGSVTSENVISLVSVPQFLQSFLCVRFL